MERKCAAGGVVFSGDGESIARATLAARVMQSMERSTAQDAMERAIVRLQSVGGEAGGIALSIDGRIGWAHSSAHFPVAYVTSETRRCLFFLRKEGSRHV
jgi:beta-aspartyl-peptidase (threonine type)